MIRGAKLARVATHNRCFSSLERLPDSEGHSAYVVHREGTGLAELHQTMAHMIYVIELRPLSPRIRAGLSEEIAT